MKKLILLAALLPASVHAALVEMWNFNDVPLGAINGNGSVTSIGVNGGVATIRGAGASAISTGGPGVRGIDLPGGASATAGYIDLANGIQSARTDATYVTWMTVNSTQTWQRVFDFGSNTNGEQTGPGGSGNGNNYTIIAANFGNDLNHQRAEVWAGGSLRHGSGAGDSFATINYGVQHQFVFVWDDIGPDNSNMSWYLNGNLVAQINGVTANLNDIVDNNNWLGRSNWGGDANTDGTYDEFAIYDTAFSGAQVSASFAAGPVPEPSTALILGGSVLALGLRRRKGES